MGELIDTFVERRVREMPEDFLLFLESSVRTEDQPGQDSMSYSQIFDVKRELTARTAGKVATPQINTNPYLADVIDLRDTAENDSSFSHGGKS